MANVSHAVMDDDTLTPDQAAPIVGAPAFQLRAWSFDRVGPKNVGTRHRPMYREIDLIIWRDDHRDHARSDDHRPTE